MRNDLINGGSLIEIIIASALISIIGIAFLTMQFYIGRNQSYIWDSYIGVEETNQITIIMTREVRNIRQAENGAYALERAWDQEFTFYSDIDLDGRAERVSYYLDGSDLTKSVIEPVGNPATYPEEQAKIRIAASNIQNGNNPIFYYYNGDWPADTVNNPLDTPTRLSDTKLLRIDLQANPEGRDEKNFEIQSYIQVRNLKDNL